ncbi:MAG: hypothetical protein OXH99_09055 [Bryobacterales bacterium]|nr:hypothetical protein [Bryobacterales bacterium]
MEAEARLDGICIARTSLPEERLGAEAAVLAYKRLTRVERALRSLKTTQLRLRPPYAYSEEHVRGYVFLCMPAYYVEWHLRRRLAPLLFEDGEPEAAAAQRDSPVKPAEAAAVEVAGAEPAHPAGAFGKADTEPGDPDAERSAWVRVAGPQDSAAGEGVRAAGGGFQTDCFQ